MRSIKPYLAAGAVLFLIFLGYHGASNTWFTSGSAPAGQNAAFSVSQTQQHRLSPDSQEKYITYLPHSGLHNQRFALINALLLGKALNRTVLMPEVNIGRSIYWLPSSRLEPLLSECPARPPTERGGYCHDMQQYVPVAVESVFDLSALEAVGIRVVQRKDMGVDYFQREFGIPDDETGFIHRIPDDTRLSYRIFDTPSPTNDLHGFAEKIDLDALDRPEPFLFFGSLFGSARLSLEREDLHWLREHLLTEIGLSHPVVLSQAVAVASLLGGPGEFVSVHLRLEEGLFRKNIGRTVSKVRETLQRHNNGHRLSHQEDFITINRLAALAAEGQIVRLLNECVAIQQLGVNRELLHPRLRMIFMATDTAQPRQTLSALFEEFVCMFSLSDFPNVIQDTLKAKTNIGQDISRYPLRYGPLLLPQVDAEIAAHGSFFVGTRKSTFTKYIQYRNQRFLNYYPSVSSPATQVTAQ